VTLATKEHKETQRKGCLKTIFDLGNTVRETAYAIHLYHGHGHLEKVYENALAHRLRKLGMEVRQQHAVRVLDEDGAVLGDFFADLLVENLLVVELKAAKALADEHVAQLLGYLKSTRLEHGLLINFGSHKFQIKKFIVNDPAPVLEYFQALQNAN
jgi:GxxExxY protein